MSLTAAQQTELERPVVRIAYFLEMHFQSATVCVSTLDADVSWGGFTWLGRGGVGNISLVSEGETLTASPLMLTLNIAQLELLAIAVGDVAEYSGGELKMYMCPLDEDYVPVDTPVRCWNGTMDAMTAGIKDDGEGQISLKCETAAFGLKRKAALRMNAAQQKQRYPSDTSFDYLTSLMATPLTWLSRKFQQI